MASNLTANSFKDLPLPGKIMKVCREPDKAVKELIYKALSIIGQTSYTPFLILTRDRTGSNMLVQYLNSHPAIRCEYEALSRLDGRSGPRVIKKLYANQPFFIRAKGFKVFYYHPVDATECARTATWSELENITSLHLIHLRRCNVLETAVSSKLAYETGFYGDLGGKSPSLSTSSFPRRITSIAYPPEKLQAVFEQTRHWEEQWPKRFTHCPILELTYEDLSTNPDAELRNVCHFLGVTESFRPRTSFRKQRTKSLRASLSNYDELKEYFTGTCWEDFFTE